MGQCLKPSKSPIDAPPPPLALPPLLFPSSLRLPAHRPASIPGLRQACRAPCLLPHREAVPGSYSPSGSEPLSAGAACPLNPTGHRQGLSLVRGPSLVGESRDSGTGPVISCKAAPWPVLCPRGPSLLTAPGHTPGHFRAWPMPNTHPTDVGLAARPLYSTDHPRPR